MEQLIVPVIVASPAAEEQQCNRCLLNIVHLLPSSFIAVCMQSTPTYLFHFWVLSFTLWWQSAKVILETVKKLLGGLRARLDSRSHACGVVCYSVKAGVLPDVKRKSWSFGGRVPNKRCSTRVWPVTRNKEILQQNLNSSGFCRENYCSTYDKTCER